MPNLLTPTRHYHALDGLRGIAALTVVAYHICLYFRLPVSPVHAYLAVDFFFMLSGFVIAHSYDQKLSMGMSSLTFLKLRALRLYPMVFLGVALGAVAFLAWAAATGHADYVAILRAAVANALLLPTPALLATTRWAFPMDTPLWSLAFELWVNLAYVFAFAFFTKRRLVAACFVGAVILVWAALTNGGLNIGYAWQDFYLGGARVLFPFMFGVLLARHLPQAHRHFKAAQLVFLVLLIVLAAPLPGGAWFDIVAVFICFPVIVVAGVAASPNRWLDPLWRWLGAISYPLYTVHYPFVVVVSNLLKIRHLETMAPYAAVGTFLFIVLVASLATFWYDEPVRALLRKWLLPSALPPLKNAGYVQKPRETGP